MVVSLGECEATFQQRDAQIVFQLIIIDRQV
ncbi:hypothetical protein N826_24085 [Skermanella aerolata KACC 11604]|nr:hypothetical protein N826_24085 [Skermanella aerolata KACC 11604]